MPQTCLDMMVSATSEKIFTRRKRLIQKNPKTSSLLKLGSQAHYIANSATSKRVMISNPEIQRGCEWSSDTSHSSIASSWCHSDAILSQTLPTLSSWKLDTQAARKVRKQRSRVGGGEGVAMVNCEPVKLFQWVLLQRDSAINP